LAVEPLEQRAMLSIGPGSIIHAAAGRGVGSAVAATSAAQHQTLADLPVAAQHAISSAIGQDESAYHAASAAAGVTLANPANGFAAQVRSGALQISAGSDTWDMSLVGLGYGGPIQPVGTAETSVNGNRVDCDYGTIDEWYVNGPGGLEQGLDVNVAPLPQGAPGSASAALTVELALGGDLRGTANAAGDGLTLRRPDGSAALGYTGLVAYDATGRTLPASLEVQAEGGRQELLIRVNTAGARGSITIDPFVQEAELIASGGVTGDWFGNSVSMSGNTVVVGAPAALVGSNSQGAAYVFTASGSGWANMTQTAELTASGGVTGDGFGAAVAISGNTIVVGAPSNPVDASGNPGPGAAYVFTAAVSGWANMTQTAKLTAYRGAAGDGFGSSVSVNGNTVVVGAPNVTVAGSSGEGAAYVFTAAASGWTNMTTQTAKLTEFRGAANDGFGNSVSISGKTVVVGVPGATVGSNGGQGAACVFTESGSVWVSTTQPTAKLTASGGAAGDSFGFSVSISGKTVVVGAPDATVGSNGGQGAAYVFVSSGSAWVNMTQPAEITASDGAAGDNFGTSVAINESGNTVVVASPWATVDAGGNPGPGAAYVFTASGSNWASATQAARLTASDGAAGDSFGCSVSISGNTVAAGAPQAALGGNSPQGAAYEFTPSGSGWANMTQTAELLALDAAAADLFGCSVSTSGNTVVVGAPAAPIDTSGNPGPGAVYVFTTPGSGWANMTQTAELTASDGAAGDGFGESVSINESGNTIVVGAPDNPVDADGNPGPGAAYVFTEPGGGWANMTQTAELTASDGAAGDWFGSAVSTSGDTVVVGAPGATTDADGNSGPGAAYVFTEPLTGWADMTQTAKLTASDGAAGDAFGTSVSISGNTVVVGAPNTAFGVYSGQGAADVFTEPGSGWADMSQTAELTASDGLSSDWFGTSVSTSGNTVVVGAPGTTVGGNGGQGAAYVFTEPGSGWADMSQTAELTASDGVSSDWFGNAVSTSGNTVVVGAPGTTVGGNGGQGAAYVFTGPGSGWADMTQTAKLTASDGAAGDGFGSAVSTSGNTVVATGGLAAYVFGPLTVTWSGGASVATWSNAANWGGVATAADDSLCFGGSAGLSNANDFAAGTPFDGMTFTAGAGAFVLGGNAVDLGGDITNNSASTQTVNLPLVLTGGSRAFNAASGNLTIAGPISQSGGSFGVTINGANTVTLGGADTYTGGTTVSEGLLVVENSTAIPSGSSLSISADGSMVLGNPGTSEGPMMAQAAPGGPLQAAMAAAGQTGTGPASLLVSSSSVTPAGGGPSPPAASDSVLAAAAAVPGVTAFTPALSRRERGLNSAAVAPAAVDRVLAARPVPDSNPVAPVPHSSSFILSPSSLLPPAFPIPHSDAAAVAHAGSRPAGDATPRVAVLRTAASGEASDGVLLRIAEARAGKAAARAGNRHPAPGAFGLDLKTLDLLAGAAARRQ
jgi:autotransporter-associated beta strand protein